VRLRADGRPTDRPTDRGDAADDEGEITYHDNNNKERGSGGCGGEQKEGGHCGDCGFVT